MCDGANSVEALTKAICTKYRLNRRQAETSVTAYLKMLAERRLVVLKTGKASAGAKTDAKATAATATKTKTVPKAQQQRRQKQA